MTGFDRDAQIRAVLIPHLRARARWVCEEFSCDGRIDVATIEENRLCGYEIKAARDSLDRLFSSRLGPMTQVALYAHLFDRLTVVCAPVHESALLRNLPSWWGVTVATADGLRVAREGDENPEDTTQRLTWVMWTKEAREFLKDHDLARGARTRADLAKRLATLPRAVLRGGVFEALMMREWGPQRRRKPVLPEYES